MRIQVYTPLLLLSLLISLPSALTGQQFPPELGKYNPGHYVAVQADEQVNDMDYLNDPAVAGISKRYLWKELEPTEGVYDLSELRADLEICQSAGKQLVAFITDKSFNQGDILPDYLDPYTLYSGSIVIVNRWHPFVVERLIALGGAFAAEFDTAACFEGIALQETAHSLEADTMSAYGYSAELYKQAYIDILTGIGDTLENSRIFWYMNFLPQGNALIGEIIDSVIPYQVVVHSPDILPYRTGLQNISYPYYDTYEGRVPLASSMQWDSYRHHKNDVSRATRDEVEVHEEGYIPMDEMFFFGRDELHLNYVFWQYITSQPAQGAFSIRDAIHVIRQYPVFNYISSVPGCFNAGGIGSFNEVSDYNAWYKNGMEYGAFYHDSQSSVSAGHSVRVEVSSNNSWQVRMFNTACTFEILQDKKYLVSFHLKGETGNSFSVALLDKEQDPATDFTVSSDNWKEYSALFTPSASQETGKVRFNFKSRGTYYIDEVRITETDCNGDPGGSASPDSCGICSNGESGILPGELCDRVKISPDSPEIRYNGTISSSISDSAAVLLRFTEEYLSSPSGFSVTKARTQSGISIAFKTASPLVTLTFDTLVNAEHRTRNFAVFRDGELMMDGISSLEFDIMNPEKALYDYEIWLPSFSGVVFKGLELISGYGLEDLDTESKPFYVAIGNSITHGVGQSFGSHLTYPFHIADSLGYRLYNLGIGGSRINSNVISNLDKLSGDPALITVLWGYNNAVFSSTDLSVPLADYKLMMGGLAEKYPTALVCGILQTYTPTTTGSNPDNSIEGLRNGQRALLKELQLEHSNIHIIDGWGLTGENDLADAVHLSNTGALNLAHGIMGKLDPSTVFSPPGAAWYYDERFAFDGNVDYIKFEVSGDTVINGKTCSVISKGHKLDCFLRPQVEYLYSEKNRVYFWDEALGDFQILYDFSARADDSWDIRILTQSELEDTATIKVDSVSYFTVNDMELLCLHVSYELKYDEGSHTYNSVIIERIGDPAYMFNWYPLSGFVCDGNYTRGLRCYEDETLGLYSTGLAESCEYTVTGIEDHLLVEKIELYPNPSGGLVHIKGAHISDLSASVYNSSGSVVMTTRVSDNILDLSHLDEGMYLCRLFSYERYVHSEILIIL